MAKLIYPAKRILIVDDQRPFLILLRGIINTLGAQSVVTVQNGESALSACRKEKFDIIIADLHLGAGRKNGYQLLEELRVRKMIRPECLFMMVSADSERPIVLGSLEQQPDDYLIKPFSQAQLHTRLTKAYTKKMTFAGIHQYIYNNQLDEAVAACRRLIASGTKYRQSCSQLLAEIYWRKQEYQQAEHLLTPLLKHRALPWLMLAMARTRYYLGEYQSAISLANDLVKNRKLEIAGHDLIAQAYLKLYRPDEAKVAINKALELSPLSIERQYQACEIGRISNDYQLVKNASKAIWEQSKKSVHRDIAHLCTYIRSILDAAEHADDKKLRNKLQQEAMLVLHRSRNDELLSRIQESFDYQAFEEIVTARVNFIDGKLLEAKRSLAHSQQRLQDDHPNYPFALAPDSIKVMFDLGEFEEAIALTQKLEESGKQLDANTRYLLEQGNDDAKQRQLEYIKYNQQGIDYYSQGKHQDAYKAFQLAQDSAPMNTGVALNLLQCILKILGNMDKVDFELTKQCRHLHRLVDGMPLPEAHQQKLDSLADELKIYVSKT